MSPTCAAHSKRVFPYQAAPVRTCVPASRNRVTTHAGSPERASRQVAWHLAPAQAGKPDDQELLLGRGRRCGAAVDQPGCRTAASNTCTATSLQRVPPSSYCDTAVATGLRRRLSRQFVQIASEQQPLAAPIGRWPATAAGRLGGRPPGRRRADAATPARSRPPYMLTWDDAGRVGFDHSYTPVVRQHCRRHAFDDLPRRPGLARGSARSRPTERLRAR